MQKKIFIIDTSILLSGKPLSLDGELYTTPKVEAEFSPGGRFYRIFQFLLELGLQILSPPREMIEIVRKIVLKTGDRLSDADIEVLALALYFKEKGFPVIILTDDYGIQNTAHELGIKYQGLNQKGITKKFKWIWRCQGCSKIFMERIDVCPICGSKLKPILYEIKTLNESDSNGNR